MTKNKATTPEEIKSSRENVEVIRNIVLKGVEELRAEKVTTTFDIERKINPKTKCPIKLISKHKIDEKVELLSFPLTEVTPKMLDDYRKRKILSFVLKTNGKLYHCEIPNNMSFIDSSIFDIHMCSISGHICKRLSATSNEEGGCEKVRNRSNYIERYNWITEGYETFNTSHDAFVVGKCLHHE